VARGRSTGRQLKKQMTILFAMVGVMWAAEVLDQIVLGGALDRLGIKPRSLTGLRGILFAPFLHGGFVHLAANTIPFILLGWLVMLRRTGDFLPVTVIVSLVGGLGVWLFARGGAVHLGASGLIFGYLGFLLLRGFFERNILSLLFSLAVGAAFGGMIWGILPTSPYVSWESHLFGFIGGILCARIAADAARHRRR